MKAWIYFAFVQLVCGIAMVIGWVLLLPWCAMKLWVVKASPYFNKDVTAWSAQWMQAVYGNWEDGVTGVGTSKGPYLTTAPDWWRAYMWCAWRNSCNNLRFAFRWYGKDGAPFFYWQNKAGTWHFKCGWFYDNGFPVLNGGRI